MFLGAKFANPEADVNRSLECLTAEYATLSDDELKLCLNAFRIGKLPGWDNVPTETYRGLGKKRMDFAANMSSRVCSDTPVLYSLVYGNWLAAPPSGLVAMYLALYNKVSL